jgi:hypothetical protein
MSHLNSVEGVYHTYGGICWICHTKVKRNQASRDHIIPKSHGGPNHWANYALAHRSCNEKRGNDHILPTSQEVIDILNKCQENACGKCYVVGKNAATTLTIQHSRWTLTGICRACEIIEKVFPGGISPSIPQQRNGNKEMDMSDVIIADTLAPYQIEIGDYIQFVVGKKPRRGIVTNQPNDNDSFFTVEIHDEEVDYKTVYNISTNGTVSLLMSI